LNELPAYLRFFTFSNVNTVYVLVGCVVLGVSAGLLGCFAFLRKRSLLGDALAHSALPGICAAFLLTGVKHTGIMLLGAVVACWLAAISIDLIARYTRVKEDSALGMVLSVYFGVGMLLLTYIQATGQAGQSGLDSYLFGQAASLIGRDVVILGAVSAGITAVVLLLYKEFKVIAFDPAYAAAIGIPRPIIETILSTLIVLAVAVGLQAVGVVLMAAMLVTPAAAARYWTNRLGRMLVIAALIGGFGGALGAYISYLAPRMPTGPWMVIAVTVIFVVSMLAAPERGSLARWIRQYRFTRRTNEENVLRTLYTLSERAGDFARETAPGEIGEWRALPLHRIVTILERLRRNGFVVSKAGAFRLTPAGVQRGAEITRLHRLWELYLTRKLELPPDMVHEDAETIEHILTPELATLLEADLEHPLVDPHAREIPAAGEGAKP